MKKISTIILLTCMVTATAITFTSCTNSSTATDKNAIPALLERKTKVGPDNEWNNIKSTYEKAVDVLKTNPDDLKQYLSIATAFIMEGRITGNGGYYSNAAIKMLDKVINGKPADKEVLFEALSLKSTVLLNMHQFKEALDVAQKGVTINDFNAGIYGALVDANVELGNYDEAVKDCDKMLGIRPDLRSYSRASYLRQIFGDNAGAIAAMKMAVEAGVPGVESTEWARVTLGDLYMNIGKIDSASYEYRASLVYRPDYPHAEMGLARVEKEKKNYAEAIAHAKKAINILSEVAFVAYLGDLYDLSGDAPKAKEVRADVVRLLEEGKKEEPKDASVQHNANREMANAYLSEQQLDKALEYANNDLKMRPENIDANELVAWIYYLKGDMTNAKMHADKLFKTNIKNANTLYKAGLIYSAAGDAAKGQSLMQQATAISPYIDQRIMKSAKAI